MADTIDLGGNTLVVNTLRVGATQPGQAGTELSGTEIAVLDGVTAGTVAAGKAVVVDSNKDAGDFRNVKVTKLVIELGADDLTLPSAAVAVAGTGAGSAGHADGAVATHVIPITIGSTTYYIPLCNTNA
jgi:hypothetical protein